MLSVLQVVLSFLFGLFLGAYQEFLPSIIGFLTIMVPVPVVIIVLLFVIYKAYKGYRTYLKLFYPKKQKIRNTTYTYQKIRNNLKTGDIIAFGGTGIGSGFIRIFTSSKYSHVGLVIKVPMPGNNTRIFFIEADDKKGVVLVRLSSKLELYKGTAYLYKLDPDPTQKQIQKNLTAQQKIYSYVLGQLGKKYDFPAIKGFVNKLLGFANLPAQDEGTFICSELVGRALQEGDYINQSINVETLAPGDITDLPCFENQKPIRLIYPKGVSKYNIEKERK